MRVLQITGYMSGAQKIITEAVHRKIIAENSKSMILYARGHSSEINAVRYESKLANFLTRGLRKYVCKHPCFSALQTFSLIRRIRQFRPDIVHLHVLHGGNMDYVMLLRFLAKTDIPIVYTMHDMWAFTGGCYHYSSLGCEKYKEKCTCCPANKRMLDIENKYIEKSFTTKQALFSKLFALHLVTVSQWVMQEVQNSFLADYPITVIPNGIEMNIANPGQHSEQHVKTQILSVAASWTEQKGIHLLFELANKLGPEYSIHLIGTASESVRKMAPANVVFLGFCSDRKKLFSYYREADLYVSASREETFGMTFVEAALMGTRSVGYAGTAICETLDSVYGVTVDEYSAEVYADAISKLMFHHQNKLSDNQVAAIQDTYSVNRMAKDYYELYKTVLKKE